MAAGGRVWKSRWEAVLACSLKASNVVQIQDTLSPSEEFAANSPFLPLLQNYVPNHVGLFFNLKDVCVCTYTFAHAHTCMYELSHPKVQLQGDGLESFKRRMLSIMINGITSKGIEV